MKKKKNYEQCYNCNGIGSTHEHIIPKFLLNFGEQGLTIPCCETCQKELKWLDDYGADYFRFNRSMNSIEEWEKWYKQTIIQNGSPMALRIFGDDVVINEDILMSFIHKVCVCISYYLYKKLEVTYSLNIITNFSKLGGYCQYNNPENESFTEEQTKKFIEKQNDIFYYLKQTIIPYCIPIYNIKNVKVFSTKQNFINGARWFNVVLFGNYEILCAVVENISPMFAQARNMMFSSLPIRIEIDELKQCRVNVKEAKSGDSIITALVNSSTSKESRELRKKELLSLGVSINDIEIFENSLSELMENKGGKERFRKKLMDAFKGKL